MKILTSLILLMLGAGTPPVYAIDRCRTDLRDGSHSYSNPAAVAKPTVHVLRQLHWREVAKDYPKIVSLIAQSQFNIARHIIAHPKHVIFAEGLPVKGPDADIYRQSVNALNDDFKFIRNAYSEGFPNEYSDLTPIQERILARIGAPFVLYSLGVVPRIYGTHVLSEEDERDLWNKIEQEAIQTGCTFKQIMERHPDLRNRIYQQREQAAVDAIRSHSSTADGSQSSLLIFGGGHEFTGQLESQGFQAFIFDMDYQRLNSLLDKENQTSTCSLTNQ